MKKNKGITLIALVITIIVLLILAAISIATLTGENGVLTKTESSQKQTKEETAKEEIKLAWAGVTADYYEGKKGNQKASYYTKENLNKELKQTGEITQFDYNEKGITSLVYKKNQNEEYYMEIDTTGEIAIKEKEEQGTITKLKQGDYIQYIDKTGTKRDCIVLYDVSSSYGIQIVTLDSVEEVTLGGDNYDEAKQSWEKAVEILNNKAKEYVNETYSITARCLGSTPDKPEESLVEQYEEELHTKYQLTDLKSDKNYEKDYEAISKLGALNISKTYWLASRWEGRSYTTEFEYFIKGVFFINQKEELMESGRMLIFEGVGEEAVTQLDTAGLRVVFTLKPSLDLQEGEGTQENPYKI